MHNIKNRQPLTAHQRAKSYYLVNKNDPLRSNAAIHLIERFSTLMLKHKDGYIDSMLEEKQFAVDQRETAVGAREKSVAYNEKLINDRLKTIDELLAEIPEVKKSAVNADVFEVERTKDGRKIPKILRDENGVPIKEGGKTQLAPTRKINDVAAELNQMKRNLESKRAEFETSSADKELER